MLPSNLFSRVKEGNMCMEGDISQSETTEDHFTYRFSIIFI